LIAPNFGQNENDTELKTGHLLNLAIMLNFFDEENLKMIKCDSQFPIAPNISLPDFQFYEHETEKDFLSQKQSRYDLQKTIEAVKSDQILVNNLAEAVVIGLTKIPDFF